MTNSAGLTGAMPISMISCPRSRTSGGFSSSSHLTKNACSGVAPNSAPLAPHAGQEGADVAPDARPQVRVVRLEDHPLRAALDRLLDVVEQPPHVDVAPGGIAAQGARAPDADAAAGEGADAVDADRVELSCSPLVTGVAALERAAHDLVGGRLVHAALVVAAGVDAGHVAARRHRASAGRRGRLTLIHG